MSFFESISRTVKGLLNDAAEAAQDPARDARQIVRDLDENIAKAESALVDVQAQVTVLKANIQNADAAAHRYGEGAEKALTGGDEALARDALDAQSQQESKAATLKAELAQLEPAFQQLKGQIDDMRHRRDQLKNRTQVIEAKVNVAAAKDVAASALGGIGGKNLTEEFSRLEEKVEHQNARADARLGMADDRSGKSLDDRLAAVGASSSVDDKLAALKAKLGKS